jgi:hypothetical protein
MSDTVKIEMSQLDGDKVISKATLEWYDMDRDGANLMSMSLAGGVLAKVDEWRKMKASGENLASVAKATSVKVVEEVEGVETPQPKGALR